MPNPYPGQDIFPLTIPMPGSNTAFTPMLIGSPIGATFDGVTCLRTHGLYDRTFKQKLPPSLGGGPSGDFVNTRNYTNSGVWLFQNNVTFEDTLTIDTGVDLALAGVNVTGTPEFTDGLTVSSGQTVDANGDILAGTKIIFDGAQPAIDANPGTNVANALSQAKAWFRLQTDGVGAYTITNGYNISTATSGSISGNTFDVNLQNGFPNATSYGVTATNQDAAALRHAVAAGPVTGTTIRIGVRDLTLPLDLVDLDTTAIDVMCVVHGRDA